MIALAQESLTSQVLAWVRGEEFASVDGLPQLALEHLWLSGLALAVACAVALPPALHLAHRGKAPVLSINLANAFRAIPAFGLLLVTFQLGGFSTVLLVLVFALIGVAPIFANTYIGIRQVDPEVIDAAAGMGLTSRQQLWQVEVPLATPVIMAGIRTAAVNIVATVPLAAVVGFGGLGEPIIAGLARGLQFSESARALALGGAVAVAVVSIASEAAFGALQRRIVPEGIRLRDAASRSGGAAADADQPADTPEPAQI
ncbi:ABC transporter permease [Euzebya sp.]|uniref:ABC transporter permease n=1 Tax=Euzebya sp. TaxID=1971409 RepID=UPI0035168C27